MTSLIYNYPTTSGTVTNFNWYERILAYITAFNQRGPGPQSPSGVTYTAQSSKAVFIGFNIVIVTIIIFE